MAFCSFAIPKSGRYLGVTGITSSGWYAGFSSEKENIID